MLDGIACAHAAPGGSAPPGGHDVCVAGGGWGGGGGGGGGGGRESPGKTRVERVGEWTPGGSPAPLLCPAASWFVITAKL